MRPRKITRLALAACLGAGMAAGSLVLASESKAVPIGEGCVEDFWMYGLRASTRVICDGPRGADGSWERRRGFFADSDVSNGYSYCSRYSCTFTPPKFVPKLEVIDRYWVTDATVLPDEPGYIESAEPRIVT